MLRNKKGRIDGRNILSYWSFIKWQVDIIILILGGGILHTTPNTTIFSLVFVLWFWTAWKTLFDTPLVLIWLCGKVSHARRQIKRIK